MSRPTASDRKFESEYLLELARQKSRESRSRLAEIMIDLFDQPGHVLSERERTMMYGILHGVIRDIEMSVRRIIAGQLAARRDVPGDLLRTLANDEIEVAYPILTQSGLLRDEDLIEVVRFRTLEHQLAIAARQAISEPVSEALVETDNESVIVTLLKNDNARIPEKTMSYLVEQSQRVDSFREPILLRKELNPAIAKRMFLWVSAALREYIIGNFSLDKQTVDDLIEQSVMTELERIAEAKSSSRKKSVELADILRKEGLVTPDMLITALREGEVPLFVAMFSRLTELRDYLVMRILFEAGGEGLAIACKGCSIGKAPYASIFSLAQKTRAATTTSLKNDLSRVLQFYDSFSREAALDVLHQWRRGADYLGALRSFNDARQRKTH